MLDLENQYREKYLYFLKEFKYALSQYIRTGRSEFSFPLLSDIRFQKQNQTIKERLANSGLIDGDYDLEKTFDSYCRLRTYRGTRIHLDFLSNDLYEDSKIQLEEELKETFIKLEDTIRDGIGASLNHFQFKIDEELLYDLPKQLGHIYHNSIPMVYYVIKSKLNDLKTEYDKKNEYDIACDVIKSFNALTIIVEKKIKSTN